MLAFQNKIPKNNVCNSDAREASVERLFQACGKVISLEFKGDFAFVEYFDETDAEKAIRYAC